MLGMMLGKSTGSIGLVLVLWFLSFLIFLPSCLSAVSNGDVSLYKPNSNVTIKEGLLEIFYNGVNGTVCYDGFNSQAADVACRELGFIKAISYSQSINDIRYNGTNHKSIISIEQCSKGNLHLLRCKFGQPHDCPNNNSVVLTCDSTKLRENPYNGQVQLHHILQNGTVQTPSEGLVQVYLKNEWGYVCYSKFTQAAANSICLQKGFTNALHFKSITIPDDDVRWTSEISCTSNSSSCFINECFKYPPNIVETCPVVKVQCTFDVSLENGRSGSETLCTISELDSSRDLHGILIGVLVTSALLIVVIIASILITCYFFTRCPLYLYRKRRHYRAIV